MLPGLPCLYHFAHPADRLAHPANRIAHPADRLAHPADRLAHPAVRVAHPAVRLAHPAVRLAHPTVRLAHPTVHLAHPTVRLAHPTVCLAHPTDRLAHPTDRFAHPADRAGCYRRPMASKLYYTLSPFPTYYPRIKLLVPQYPCLSFSRFHLHLVSVSLEDCLPSPERPEPQYACLLLHSSLDKPSSLL